ncbi:MAG: redoxin domain-containing protein [Solirubrobacteraceae bacterium]
MRLRAFLLVAVLIAAGAVAQLAWADGDPGSDVLVFQNLFVAGDAGLSVSQQAQLQGLLQAASRSGFPVRVAIIATRSDLGSVTALWRKPQAYAQFLGIELSLAYKQRLLVVMPNGLGFNYPGHSIAPADRILSAIPIASGGSGLVTATEAALHALASAGGVRIGSSTAGTAGAASAGAGGSVAGAASSAAGANTASAGANTASASASATGTSPPGHSTDTTVAIVTVVLLALAALAWGARKTLRRRAGSPLGRRARLPGFAVLFGLAALTPILLLAGLRTSGSSSNQSLQINPDVDPGTQLHGQAADFTLSDQFGRRISLHSFRGKVVVLAFTDSECTTICPMTTTAMLDAKAMLGAAGSDVQLLGVDANPASTSLEDVWSYSQLHGMLHAWHFLTGSLTQLRPVWKDYAVYADIEHGLIAHTPALYVIGPRGRQEKVYITQQSYSAVGQFGQVLAQEISSLLPGHPKVRSNLSYAPIQTIGPASISELPRAGGGTVELGPGRSPRLYVFFATWDQEITSLAGDLDQLDRYESSAAGSRLPALTAVDEGTVEPSRAALPAFLRSLPRPLSYPVAIDTSGRVADGYQVLGEPWFVLVSATGRILWYWQVSTSGWPSDHALAREMRAALARAPKAPTSAKAISSDLAGAPAPLAALHEQADQLLGAEPALAARIRALRGYPIVLNAWASWCTACRAEFGLLASASATYGRRVAFIGADTDDPGDAQAFLAQHPVGYPSYPTNTSDLSSLAAIEGLPTTIFIDSAGKVDFVHTGEYDSQGILDQDIQSYALGG